MSNSSRFNGLARNYAQFRPSYPPEVFEQIRGMISAEALAGAPILIDVGCGTGISTRLLWKTFADVAGARIVGLEPSDEMRMQAAGATGGNHVEYRAATAEALPLADRSASLVMAAQAAHWFDRPRFFAEAARVLAPGGVVALVFNNRRWQDDPFQEEYEQFIERVSPGYRRGYRDFDFAGELQASKQFAPAAERHFDWQRSMTRDEFFGLSFSTTYIRKAVEASSRARIEAELEALWSRRLPDDAVLSVPYRTDLLAAERL